jgi:long-chain fatty acid transport protein
MTKTNARWLTLVPSAVLALAVSAPGQARAAGYYFGEQDPVAMSRGLAVTAKLEAPSVLFYNPAGMAFLDGLQVQVGSLFVMPTFEYSDPQGRRPSENADFKVTVVPHIYASYTFLKKGSVGVGFNAPFGLGLTWPTGFAGERYAAGTDLKMPTIYFAGAYRPLKWLSFGMTLRVVPATIEVMQKFQVVTDAGATDYGYAHLAASAIGVGASAGVMVKPIDRLHIGFNYLSRIKFDFNNGIARFGLPQGTGDVSTFHDQAGTSSMTSPDVLSFGVGYDVTDKLYLEFDYNYTLWSVFKEQAVDFDNDPSGAVSKPTPKNWKNASCFRLGGEYRFNDSWAVRLAGIYDQSPIPDSTVSPDLPDANRVVFATGVGYRYPKLGLRADLGYELVWFMERTALTSDGNPFPANYKTVAHLIGISLGLGQ